MSPHPLTHQKSRRKKNNYQHRFKSATPQLLRLSTIHFEKGKNPSLAPISIWIWQIVDPLLHILEAREENRVRQGRSCRSDRESLVADPLEVFNRRHFGLLCPALLEAGALVGGFCALDGVGLFLDFASVKELREEGVRGGRRRSLRKPGRSCRRNHQREPRQGARWESLSGCT